MNLKEQTDFKHAKAALWDYAPLASGLMKVAALFLL